MHDTKVRIRRHGVFLPFLTVYNAVRSLAEPQPRRRGAVSERFVKCSKPGCPCASDPKARRGPYYSLTRAVRGQTQSRFLHAAQEITQLMGRQAVPTLDLEALEMAAWRNVLQLAARAIERWLHADTSDYTGPHLRCACGASAR